MKKNKSKVFVIKRNKKTYAILCSYDGEEFEVTEWQTNHKKVERLPKKVGDDLMRMAVKFYYGDEQ